LPRRGAYQRVGVTQGLQEGKIDGAAIVGSGQRALINVDLACAQLQERLATDERYGLNGLSTNISTTTISPRPVRANSETFRHRIPAEADALEAPRGGGCSKSRAGGRALLGAKLPHGRSARARGSGRLRVAG
jgi:hypothetical protein